VLPPKEYCKKYCDLYPCSRIECNRKPMWNGNSPIKMEEPKVYDNWRTIEKKRAYKSSPLTKAELNMFIK